MAQLADYNQSWPAQRIFTNLELFFNNLIEFQGLKGVNAARIVYEVCIYCSTADKYDQIYLKSANNWALAHLSTQADLCDITLVIYSKLSSLYKHKYKTQKFMSYITEIGLTSRFFNA